MLRQLIGLLVLVAASPVWADQGELYAQVSAAPVLSSFDDPAGGSASALRLGLGTQVAAFYGLTDTLHLGASLRFGGARDVAFSGLRVRLADGSQPLGTLYEDAYVLGAGALAHYRLDTGENWAPFAQLELGAVYHRYARLQHVPEGTTLSANFPEVGEWALSGRATVGLEYRFADRFFASLALGVRRNLNALTVWQVELPASAGIIW